MTVDVNDANDQSSSDAPVRSLQSVFNEMYPALASPPRVVGIITVRHGSRLYTVTPREQSSNHEISVPLPRNSVIDLRSPMVHESPDAREGGSLESPSRTSPLERRTQSSSNRANEDVTLPLECEARVLSRVVNIVGMELLDFENFTAGGYEDCDQAIQRARELSSLESSEGKDSLLCLCGWHIYHGEHEKHDRFLTAFAVERFRQKHDGVVGDSMAAQTYNRYLGYMKILDGLKLCIDNNEPDYHQ